MKEFYESFLKEWCNINGRPMLTLYFDVLTEAHGEHEPCYVTHEYGEKFRVITSERKHFAAQQLNNSVEEAFGAQRLLRLARDAPKDTLNLPEKFLRHAEDEIRHNGVFLALYDVVFPDIPISASLKSELEEASVRANYPLPVDRDLDLNELILEVVQINIGEFRNLVQLKLAKPMIEAHCLDDSSRSKASEIMDGLISDECSHVYYTGVLMERLCDQGHRDRVINLAKEATYLFDQEARQYMWPSDAPQVT